MKQLFATSILAASVITVCSMCSTGTDNNNSYKKAMFVTESTYDGDLETAAKNLGYQKDNKESGIGAANYLCNNAAQKIGYSGEFKALINTNLNNKNIESIITTTESTPYYNISDQGIIIESSVAFRSVKGATSGSAFLVQESGFDGISKKGATTNWVGNNSNYCKDYWGDNSSSGSGRAGTGKVSTNWNELTNSIYSGCDQKLSLVCVQQ